MQNIARYDIEKDFGLPTDSSIEEVLEYMETDTLILERAMLEQVGYHEGDKPWGSFMSNVDSTDFRDLYRQLPEEGVLTLEGQFLVLDLNDYEIWVEGNREEIESRIDAIV